MRTRARWRTGAIAVAMMSLAAVGSLATTGAQAAPKPLPVRALALQHHSVAGAVKISPRVLASKDARQTVFVQLRGQGAADLAARSSDLGRSSTTVEGQTKVRRGQVRVTASEVTDQARRTDSQARRLFTITNSVPGLGLEATGSALADIAGRADVVKITPIVPKTIDNAASGQLIKALATWQQTGKTGKGVRVGVIDSGIDYTHADFGGAGTVAAYQAAHETADSGDPWTPTAKVVGGWDFVGDAYNPDSADPAARVPRPDPNPLDCEGHGTHVAGTAAGYGVTAGGTTFSGSYRSLTASTLRAMKIGPGMAPQASLYALRVFGCEGGTDMVLPALDWALDPNGDGNFSDHLDIVNLSLGTDFLAADDPENAVVDNLARHGVLPVISSGNGGDITDIGGSSGNSPRALTVASSVDDFTILDQLKVNAPAAVAGLVSGQASSAYPWVTASPVTGTVIQLGTASNLDGCAPLSDADKARVAGKIAWLEWDDNADTRRCGSTARSANVAAAGAIGALFTSTLDQFNADVTGSATIPVFQLTGQATGKLRSAATAGTLQVTFDPALLSTLPLTTPGLTDTVSDFSSRGTHGAPGVVKPDVSAPGETIISAAVGSGNGRANISGTSQAAPHIAGVAALVKQVHPTWTTEQLKAAVMNTAVHDLYTGQHKTGHRYGPVRVGSGRTDARYATSTVILAYNRSKPGVVSASFGVVEAPITAKKVTWTQSITISNRAFGKRKVTLRYSPTVKQPGVSYSVRPARLTLKARSTRTVKVTMTVRPRALRRTIDPTMSKTTVGALGEEPRQFVADASGNLQIKPSGKTALRVPVYGAAKPVSATTLSATTIGGTKVLEVSGAGVAQGSGRTAFASPASVLTLGATSRKLPTCAARQTSNCVLNDTARASDLQYVGSGSVQGDSSGPGIGWFGFSTWGNWSTLAVGGAEVAVAVDTDGDGHADYHVVYLPGDVDQPLSVVFDAQGHAVDAQPVNFLDAATDTNAYDTNAATLPFLLSDLGVPGNATSFPIRYQVTTWSDYGDPGRGYNVDSTGWIVADLVKPALSVPTPLFSDINGSTVPYVVATSTTTAEAAGTTDLTGQDGARPNGAGRTIQSASPVQALVLHLYGRSGQRAQVLSVP